MKHLNHFVFPLLCLLLSANYLKAQDTSWYNEGRTIFTLTTAEQIIGLRDLVNSGTSFAGKIIKLGNDIDLSSTNWYWSIGYSDTRPFRGTFDGCNHTINYKCSYSGSTYTYFGLFGNAYEITRLTVKGSINLSSSKAQYIGGIVACPTRVSKCKNEMSITLTNAGGSCWIGGIGGYRGSYTDCINDGKISVDVSSSSRIFYVGGISGECSDVHQCENLQSITVSASSGGCSAFVGGIIGRGCSSPSISYCRNVANIWAVGNSKNGRASAGGVIGQPYMNTMTINHCYTACSSIYASALNGASGPIFGDLVYTNRNFYVEDCFANSDISYNRYNGSIQAGKELDVDINIDDSFTLADMKTIDFANRLSNSEVVWIGGDGVLPIVSGSKSESDAYTTYQEPSEISFDNNVIDMPVEGREEVLANVLPLGAYPKLTWESSNPDVVTVDEDGVLWSLGLGYAVITATSLRNADVKATCNVHVGTTDLRSIILPETVMVKMNESKKIEREFVPSYAKRKLTWESADELVATVDQSGNVTGVAPGITTITVTDNLTNVQATCTVSVIMEVGDTFNANIPNGTGTVSTTFMLTDWENRYVSIGDGTNAAIAAATTGGIVIPETIVGPGNLTYTVNAISSNAFVSSKMTSVTIPQGITAIGDYAFLCSSLTSVTVESTEPSGITIHSFSTLLWAILYVPKGSYEVYKAADVWKSFGTIVEPPHTNDDTFTASITAGSGTTDAVFKVIDAANKYVGIGNGEEAAIPDYTSGNVVVPSTVTGYDGQTYRVKQISDAAFFDCYEVTSFQLPSDITTIGRLAFYDCAGLTSFTIPTSVTTIGEEAFNNCYNLTSINIPSSVASLGTSAFYGCSKLTTVTVKWIDPVEIDAECFTNVANATLNIPKGSYGNYATADNWKNFKTIKEPAHSVGDTFRASIIAGGTKVDATFKVTNTSNKNVSIGDGEDAAIDIFASGNINIPSTVNGYDGYTYTVKTVADAAFFGCENITSISLPSSITEIGNSAFLRCYSLANITIPTNVTRIGNEAFFYCEKLASITIPKNVISIGTNAFKNCNMLTSVTAGRNTPIAIDSECFSNAANATLNVPYGAKERYEAATGWKLFKNIVEMAPKDGDMFTTLTAGGVKMTFVVISASAKTCKVGDGSNASVPTNTEELVTIPTTANGFAVTQINSKAFYNCYQIVATEIPTCISSIGTYAFSGCNNLTSVTVGWSEPISISTNCFSNAANASLYVPIGTNYDYSIATGWQNFGQIANGMENVLAVDDIIGRRGGKVTLPILMNNTDAITSVSFKLVLPNGCSLNECMLSSRKGDHIIYPEPQSDGSYLVTAFSINNQTFQGNEGTVMNLTIDIDGNVEPGEYPITLQEIELSTEDYPIYPANLSTNIAVDDFLEGDANGNGEITPFDAVLAIRYYLGKSPSPFWPKAANVNGDKKDNGEENITPFDAVSIIRIYLDNNKKKNKAQGIGNIVDEKDPQ